jgi:hypothetical protein
MEYTIKVIPNDRGNPPDKLGARPSNRCESHVRLILRASKVCGRFHRRLSEGDL